MKIKRINLILIFLFSVLPKTVGASDFLWLQTEKYEPAKRKPTTLSLYFGDFPNGNIKLDKVKFWVLFPDGSLKMPKLTIKDGQVYASFAAKQGGQYTAVALFKTTDNKILTKHYAKLQFHRFGKEVKRSKAVAIPRVPLEIKPITRLNMHRRLYEGGEFTVQVLYKGKPLNTEVSVSTQEGWKKKFHTNNRGIARIRFIKDRVSTPKEKRLPERYLFFAEYAESGVNPSRYTATYALNIYPTPWEWQSKTLAYLTVLVAMASTVIIVAVKRRRVA